MTGEALRTAEVARAFGVSRATICRWARAGKIPSVSTPGGHRRYRAEDIERLLAQDSRP